MASITIYFILFLRLAVTNFILASAIPVNENGEPLFTEANKDDIDIPWSPMDQKIVQNDAMNPVPGVPAETSQKLSELRRAWRESQEANDISGKTSRKRQDNSFLEKSSVAKDDDDENLLFDGDIILEQNMIDWMTELLQEKIEHGHNLNGAGQQSEESNRVKRKRRRATVFAHQLWENPQAIPFKFDGTHSAKEKNSILEGMKLYMVSTCLRFYQLPINDFGVHHILFTKGKGCFSAVGRQRSSIFQLVSIGDRCAVAGIVAHELGHALGMFHEQARPDRDNYIKIMEKHIQKNYEDQFIVQAFVNNYSVPYDLSSLMHYGGRAYSKSPAKTLVTLDPLRQQTLGQQNSLSWGDTLLFNRAYCSDICKKPTLQPCKNGGIQNPSSCDTCLCPPGFGSDSCSAVASGVEADCGGEFQLQADSEMVIQTPGYEDGINYSPGTECSWLVKAPASYRIEARFTNEFQVHCSWWSSECFSDWAEVKIDNKRFNETGYRFCCTERPDVVLESLQSEIMVLLRASGNRKSSSYRGFKMTLRAKKVEAGNESHPIPSDIPERKDDCECSEIPNVVLQLCARSVNSKCRKRKESSTFCYDEVAGKWDPCTKMMAVEYLCPKTVKACCKNAALVYNELGQPGHCVVPEWSSWSGWSACSALCGGCGTSERIRTGTSVFSQHNERELQSCNMQKCDPTDCHPPFCKNAAFKGLSTCQKPCTSCCSGYDIWNGQCQIS